MIVYIMIKIIQDIFCDAVSITSDKSAQFHVMSWSLTID